MNEDGKVIGENTKKRIGDEGTPHIPNIYYSIPLRSSCDGLRACEVSSPPLLVCQS